MCHHLFVYKPNCYFLINLKCNYLDLFYVYELVQNNYGNIIVRICVVGDLLINFCGFLLTFFIVSF